MDQDRDQVQMGELGLSGKSFRATYQLLGGPADVAEMAERICVEQTVEFPPDLIEREDIRERIIAKVARLEEVSEGNHRAVIEYPLEVAGSELTQLLNVLYGNISLLPGIRLVAIDLPDQLLADFDGPRFGRHGLRELLGVEDRPLLATALKPMGHSPRELAHLAEQLALGGMDLIKDDHGLADQSFCPFAERVERCAAAVHEINAKTGGRCLYFANITAPYGVVEERAARAKEAGAGGLVVAPGLTGHGAMAALASDDSLELPILSHPAFQGDLSVSTTSGIAHGVIYGQINRLAGADGVIFPSYGGRFAFSKAQCRDLVDGTQRVMGSLPPIIPAPAGGMSLDRVEELLEFFGLDVMLLIGGDLHRHGSDLIDACRRFIDLVAPS